MPPPISSQMALDAAKDHPPPTGKTTLDKFPQEVLENIAVFCGNVARVSPSEEVDTFTNNLINPYLDSEDSNTWTPSYKDLRSLALVSTAFINPAQRALFKIAMVKTTGQLMRFLRSLRLYPKNRRYVRVFIATLKDYGRSLPFRHSKPDPLVLEEFFHYFGPLATSKVLPKQASASTEFNLHTIEDQVLTIIIRLLPNLDAFRICFGLLDHNGERSTAATQPEATQGRLPPYASLLENDLTSKVRAITLDFGALVARTNLNRFVSGYKTGIPPNVERLTLVGNLPLTKNIRSYNIFNLMMFGQWLASNNKLRELRMLHGFGRHIAYHYHGPEHDAQPGNWNSILLRYKDTFEVLVLYQYCQCSGSAKAHYGSTGRLDCLPQMKKLRYLKVPLHALSGEGYGEEVPRGSDVGNVTKLIRTELPPNWKTLDVACRDGGRTFEGGKFWVVTWKLARFERLGSKAYWNKRWCEITQSAYSFLVWLPT